MKNLPHFLSQVLRPVLLLTISLVFLQLASAQSTIYDGDVYVSTSSMTEIPDGVTEITGTLTIEGRPGASPNRATVEAKLSSLTTVGALYLKGLVYVGCPELQIVQEDFTVASGAASAVDLATLFPKLNQVTGRLSFSCNACTSVVLPNPTTAESVTISSNSLHTIKGFSAANSQIAGRLSISRLKNLHTLDAFNGLITVGDIMIKENRKLQTISAFAALKECYDQIIIEVSSPAITAFPSFAKLETAYTIQLEYRSTAPLNIFNLLVYANSISIVAPNLESLTGFGALESAGSLKITGPQKISGFSALTEVQSGLEMVGQRLTEIPAFESLTQAGSISLGSYGRVPDATPLVINGFNALTQIEGDLQIGTMNYKESGKYDTYASNITSISGFTNLTGAQNIEIRARMSDGTLTGFTAVEGTNSLKIYDVNFPALGVEQPFNNLQYADDLTLEQSSFPDGMLFNQLSSVGKIIIKNCDFPTPLSGFNALEYPNGSIHVFYNNNLQEISGFQSLTAIPYGGLYLAKNRNLRKITGFNSLSRIQSGLVFYGGNSSPRGPSTADLSGLAALREVGLATANVVLDGELNPHEDKSQIIEKDFRFLLTQPSVGLNKFIAAEDYCPLYSLLSAADAEQVLFIYMRKSYSQFDGQWKYRFSFTEPYKEAMALINTSCDGDKDGDGYRISQGDRDDQDANSYPGAPEICDGKDNDFDGTVDEDLPYDAQAIIYVKADASGQKDGTSWANAYPDLTMALAATSESNCRKTIWVAGGTYYPPTDAADQAFTLPLNVRLYGGFAGTEAATFDLSTRDFSTNTTILSGDVKQNDGAAGANRDDNIRILSLVESEDASTVVLDGITFQAGRANDGAAINTEEGSDLTTVAISNCRFLDNVATAAGGAIYAYEETVALKSSHFENNTADQGGAVATRKDITIEDCQFIGNEADRGGAIHPYAGLVLTDCSFEANLCTGAGGALYAGSSTITNCTFTSNQAGNGGGAMYLNTWASGDVISITDCTFDNNQATGTQGQGGAIDSWRANINLTSITFTNNSAVNGGAVYYEGDTGHRLNFTNCQFTSNTATKDGGAVSLHQNAQMTVTNTKFTSNSAHDGGGLSCYEASEVDVINCVFRDNTATNNGSGVPGYGGGIYNHKSSPNIINCTLSGNRGDEGGGIANHDDANPVITNTIIWGNNPAVSQPGKKQDKREVFNSPAATGGITVAASTPVFTYSLVRNGIASGRKGTGWRVYLGTGSHTGPARNYAVDPLFVSTTDLSLQVASPALNKGSDTANSTTLDAAGKPRKNGTIDIGAYEKQ